MNINIIKNKLKELSNEKLIIKVYLGRNKYEYLEGKINKMHQNIFTVNTNKGLKSFSYSDVVTKAIVIRKFD